MIKVIVDKARTVLKVADVTRELQRKTERVFIRFGAYVRTAAMRSMKSSKKISDPGKPPNVHIKVLRDRILFAWIPGQRAVVIGPKVLDRTPKVAAALEKGGTVEVVRRSGQVTINKVRARPFMKPAFDKELKNIDKLWSK